jgi:glutathione synthase/RimK-type ligase-like ATP-grasp enzyme
LNSGDGAWAFEPLAVELSRALQIEVFSKPRRFNYLLHVEDGDIVPNGDFFIPVQSIRLAADKRLLATVFAKSRVPTPVTRLFEAFEEARRFVSENPDREWCLKYPTSCGANGHRMISGADAEPPNWPRPFIVQEFVRLERPEVYRVYCAGGELFGWVARRFPEGVRTSPWVAHARGARYARLGDPPAPALEAARSALVATGLFNSFGCVDLLRSPAGDWLVLEVGTDGLFNHVDRDLDDPDLENELRRRVADAFWKAVEGADLK